MVIDHEVLESQPQLPEIPNTLRSLCFLLCPRERRQQCGREQGNNSEDNQKFQQAECVSVVSHAGKTPRAENCFRPNASVSHRRPLTQGQNKERNRRLAPRNR
jgi:hypothetical protein